MNINIPITLGTSPENPGDNSVGCLMALAALVTLQVLATEQSSGLAAFTNVK